MARRGYSLLESLVVLGVFSLLMTVVAVLFFESSNIYRRTDSADSASRELRKVRAALERDLVLASPDEIQRAPVPGSLGAGQDGEALWFLSPIDPATGATVRKHDGSPFWQRNILYYLVVPAGHNALFGVNCPGAAGPTGYEDGCSHKVLIRKEIDAGTPTDPTDETTEETLITNIAPYLSAPNGYDLSAMTEAGLTEKRIVASSLLHFETFTAPPPAGIPSELLVDVRALSIAEARRKAGLGTSAYTGPFTLQSPFSVSLRN